jgi:hypothetical protein
MKKAAPGRLFRCKRLRVQRRSLSRVLRSVSGALRSLAIARS